MIKAIFFDFDGTISDTHSFISKTFIELLEKEEYFIDKSKINHLIGEKVEFIFKSIGITKEINYLRKKFYASLENNKTKLTPCVPLRPLRLLKKKYLMIVISNAETSFAKFSARKLKVDSLFKEIHGAETFKSKDEIMKRLFKKYNLNPKEVIYIGDRFSDVEYAKKADCWAVAIHNKCSWSSKKLIKQEHPDFIIKDFSEVEKVIRKINNE
jgi:HAD superfamily hydrolase (TIGR01549 family)